jgi:hypothetical protein
VREEIHSPPEQGVPGPGPADREQRERQPGNPPGTLPGDVLPGEVPGQHIGE